jgi:ribosomal protein S12 methylthiotransferase accessory factor
VSLHFSARLRIDLVAGEGVLVTGDRRQWLLSGDAYEALAPTLCGVPQALARRDVEAAVGRRECRLAIARLQRMGLVVATAPSGERHLTDGTMIGAADTGIIAASDHLMTIGRMAWRSVEQTVKWPRRLLLAVVTDIHSAALVAAHDESRRHGEALLLCRVAGDEHLLGPLVSPTAGPCLHCLTHRIRLQSPVHAFLARATAAGDAHCLRLPLADLTSLASLRRALQLWAQGWFNRGRLMVREPRRQRETPRPLRARPECPVCGDPRITDRAMTAPVVLQSRVAHLQGLGARRQELTGPVTGVVRDVTRLPTGIGDSIYVCSAGALGIPAAIDLPQLRRRLLSRTIGKGTNSASAQDGALGEAVERASLSWHGDEPVWRATQRQVGAEAIPPNDVLLFSRLQFAKRDRWNRDGVHTRHVPERLERDVEIGWTPVWSITHRRRRFLPTALLFHGYVENAGDFARADSSGVAAGTSRADALRRALLELIERDAVAIWWYNRRRVAGLGPAGLGLPLAARTLRELRVRGRRLHLLDLTTDIGVPVVAAVSARARHGDRVLFGFGAGVDYRAAAERAIAELHQMFAALRARDDPAAVDPELAKWLAHATLANAPYIEPVSLRELRPTERSFAAPHASDISELRRVRGRLERRGLEVLALDLTRAGYGVPVMRAIVPGLRHFWPRFAPGRLYDVPSEMNGSETVLRESELNPVPFFL